MKKPLYISAMLAMAALTTIVLLKFVILGKTGDVGDDGRTPVILTEHERDYVFGEMRGLIEGLIAMNEAALDNDTQAFGAAAKSLGMHANPSAETTSVMGKLPVEFKIMGVGLHKDFDKIATLAKSGATITELQRALTDNMYKCVACHASYKIEAE